MTTWSKDELHKIAQADDLHISSSTSRIIRASATGAPSTSPRPSTPSCSATSAARARRKLRICGTLTRRSSKKSMPRSPRCAKARTAK